MRTFDLTPYRRSTVGFDRLFDMLEAKASAESPDGFPPFDLEKEGENNYRITIAVPGFNPDEVDVIAQQNLLTVKGAKAVERDEERFLHRGISTRSFERRFALADFVQVQSANFENGLLRITLNREVPEAMKPRKIEIGAAPANDGRGQSRIETKAA